MKKKFRKSMKIAFDEASALLRVKMVATILLLFSMLSWSLAEDTCVFTSSSVSCVEQSGKFLPVKVSSDISSLYIIQSDLNALTAEDFAIFESVYTLSIINSTLLFPKHKHLLRVIPDLSILRIVNCNVSEDVRTVFAGNERITHLDLSQNKITALTKELFAPIMYAEQINLSHNKITRIEVGTFDGLTSLRVLNLTDNNIGVSFDSAFLTIQSAICAVCREQFGNKDCSNDDFARCKNNEPEDQLWWISTKVTIHLKENPICAIITGNVTTKRVNQSSNKSASKNLDSCKVYDHGHCFKHESRRMFFLDACGIKKMPLNVVTEKMQDDSAVRAQNTMPWYVIPLVIVSVFVGAVITVLLVKKGIIAGNNASQGREDGNPSLNTSSREGVSYSSQDCTTLIIDGHQENSESQECDQLITDNENNLNIQTMNVIEYNRNFPFHDAIVKRNLTEIRSFLQQEEYFRVKNQLGDYPIHLAAKINDTKTTKLLLKSKVNVDVNIQNNAGDTPLIIAARENNFETLSILLDNKADYSLSNFYGVEPLHLASWNGNCKMIDLLLKQGAEINKADTIGKTPLYYASTEEHIEAVKLLLENRANVNDSSQIRRSPLHIAAWNNYLLIVDILLNYNADVEEEDSGGFTPLHKASRKGHVNVIKKLMSCKKMDVNRPSNCGNTPLHQAAKGGHIEAIQFLLQKGANSKLKNEKGFTPWDTAKDRGQSQRLRFLKFTDKTR